MEPVWDLFRAAMGLAVDVTRDMVTAYLKFVTKLAKGSAVFVIVLLSLLIPGSIFRVSWMNGLCVAVAGLIVVVWLTAAFPLIMLAQYTYEEIPRVRKMVRVIVAVLFWTLLLAIYFYRVPVWNYPAAIPLVLMIFAVLAIGFIRFGIGLNPKLALTSVVLVFFLLTISFYLPASHSTAHTLVGWLDNKVARLLRGVSHPTPHRIECDYLSFDKIEFFDPITGEPQVWYYAGQDGTIELFDGSGYHPHYKKELQPVDPNIVAEARKQQKVKAESIAQQPQKMKKIECDYSSFDKIEFFDPITGEPQVWYYAGQDGAIELFDGPGYHPHYKKELQPIDPNIVAEARKQQKAKAESVAEKQRKTKEASSDAEEEIVVLEPEDTQGEVQKPKGIDLVRRPEKPIEPEDPNGKVSDPKEK